MLWTEKFIKPNKFSRPQKKLIAVKKLVIHYTANNGATASNHFDYFNNLKDRYASAHIFVDKKEAINIIPLNEISYHANDIQKHNADGSAWRGIKELLPNANYLSIGVEMCLEEDGSFHTETIKRAEDVMVELCKIYNLNPLTDIVRHYDITAKNCPAPWVSNSQLFIDFKNRINNKLTIPMWKGTILKEGQIGKITILKPINLWIRVNEELKVARILKVSETYPVYGYDDKFGGQYNVGSGYWITNMADYIEYETPSKELIEQAQIYYKAK